MYVAIMTCNEANPGLSPGQFWKGSAPWKRRIPPLQPPPHPLPEEVHKNIIRCYRLRSRVDRKLLHWLGILIEKATPSSSAAPGPSATSAPTSATSAPRPTASSRPPGPSPASPHRRRLRGRKDLLVPVEGDLQPEEGQRDHRGTWLEFARTHSADELREEVKDAKRRGRGVPRKAGSAILNRHVHLDFSLTLADRELIRKALEKKAAEMMASGKYKEGERPTPEEVLLALCREILETEVPGGGSDRVRAFCDMVFLSAAGIP